MRLIFMGTPQFAVPALLALEHAGHDIAGVVTRVDKPAGRGRSLSQPAVKQTALNMGLAVYQPHRVRDPDFVSLLKSLAPDAIVVAAYGQILPREILGLPRFGCINIHASLLPLYRGAAPIQWAVINGEAETGITIMQMDEGMDTGDILMQKAVSIFGSETAAGLMERLSALGAELIVEAMPLIEAGEIKPVRQDHSRATYAPLLKKEDGLIDWGLPAQAIYNRVRGLLPWPVAFSYLDGKMIKILEADIVPGTGEPGVIATEEGSILVGTWEGLLRIKRLQVEGRNPVTAAEFLRGHRHIAGRRFGKA